MLKALDTVIVVLCVRLETVLLKRASLPLETAKYRIIKKTAKLESLRGKQNVLYLSPLDKRRVDGPLKIRGWVD